MGKPGGRADRKGNCRRREVDVQQRRSFASYESLLFQGLDLCIQALTRYRMEIYRKIFVWCALGLISRNGHAPGARIYACCRSYLRAPWRFENPAFRPRPGAGPVACGTTQDLSRRNLIVIGHWFSLRPHCCLPPKRCHCCAMHRRHRWSRPSPAFHRSPEEFVLALFAMLLELGIAIGHSLPREPSRAGLPKKEKGASWKSSSSWRLHAPPRQGRST